MTSLKLPPFFSAVLPPHNEVTPHGAHTAERVIGNRLQIRELSLGLIEVLAVGTAVRRIDEIAPHSQTLHFQAIVRDDDSLNVRGGGNGKFVES